MGNNIALDLARDGHVVKVGTVKGVEERLRNRATHAEVALKSLKGIASFVHDKRMSACKFIDALNDAGRDALAQEFEAELRALDEVAKELRRRIKELETEGGAE